MGSDAARTRRFRDLCAEAAQARSRAGPWLRRRDRPAVSASLEMRLGPAAGEISCMAFAGAVLAAGASTGTLTLWETDSGRADLIDGPAGSVLALSATLEGRLWLCAAAGAGDVDIAARRWIPAIDFDGVMTAAAFADDAMAAGDSIGRIEIWDLAARARVFVHAGRRVPVVRIGWSPDQTVVVAAHSSGLLTVIDVPRRVARTRASSGPHISAILPAASGSAVHLARRDGSIARFQDLDRPEEPVAALDHQSIQTAVAFPAGGILAGCASGLVTLLRMANGAAESRGQFMFDGSVHALAVDARRGLIAASDGRRCELHAVEKLSAAPDDDFAAATRPGVLAELGTVVGGRDGHVHVTRDSGVRVRIEQGVTRFAGPAAAAAAAPVWAAAHGSGNWRAWNVAQGHEIGSMGAGGRVTAIDVSPDGVLVATGYDSGFAIIWDAETGAERGRQPVHDRPVEAVAFHPDRPHLLTAGSDRRVRLWRLRAGTTDARSGEHVAFVTGSTRGRLAKVRLDAGWECLLDSPCRALAFASGSDAVYGACTGRIIELHAGHGRVAREFTGHDADWRDVATSPDGRFLAAADRRGAICVWDRESGAITARGEIRNAVLGLVWSRGRELAAATTAGELALLTLEGVAQAPEAPAVSAAWSLERWESPPGGESYG